MATKSDGLEVDTETENQILSVGREFLPACALLVLDGGAPGLEYRVWLAAQAAAMSAGDH